jgi:hypothetical protein
MINNDRDAEPREGRHQLRCFPFGYEDIDLGYFQKYNTPVVSENGRETGGSDRQRSTDLLVTAPQTPL